MNDRPIDASDLLRIERALAGSPKGDETIAIVRVMRDAQINAAQLSRAVWDDVRPLAGGGADFAVSAASSRVVPAGARARSWDRYLSIATMRVLAPRRGLGTEPLFAKADGAPFSSATVIKRIRDAAAEAGLHGRFGGSSPALGMERDSGSWLAQPNARRVRTWYALGGHWPGLLGRGGDRLDEMPAWAKPLLEWRETVRHRDFREAGKANAGLLAAARGARLRAMLTIPAAQPGDERRTGAEWKDIGIPGLPASPYVPRAYWALEPVRRLAREFGMPLDEVADIVKRANVEVSCIDRPGRRWPPRPGDTLSPYGDMP